MEQPILYLKVQLPYSCMGRVMTAREVAMWEKGTMVSPSDRGAIYLSHEPREISNRDSDDCMTRMRLQGYRDISEQFRKREMRNNNPQ